MTTDEIVHACNTCASDCETVRQLRQRVTALEGEIEGLNGVLTMTVARLGGKVEGYPTQRINFLQRIDALVTKETVAADMLTLLREFASFGNAFKGAPAHSTIAKTVALVARLASEEPPR